MPCLVFFAWQESAVGVTQLSLLVPAVLSSDLYCVLVRCLWVDSMSLLLWVSFMQGACGNASQLAV